ncbi:8176_t:CDS:2, partial [Gigaspora margarita]
MSIELGIITYNENYKNTKLHKISEIPSSIRNDIMREFLKNYKTCLKDYYRVFGHYSFLKEIVTSEKLSEIKHDYRIAYDKLDHFFICILIELEKKSKQGVIVLDPGIQPFITG